MAFAPAGSTLGYKQKSLLGVKAMDGGLKLALTSDLVRFDPNDLGPVLTCKVQNPDGSDNSSLNGNTITLTATLSGSPVDISLTQGGTYTASLTFTITNFSGSSNGFESQVWMDPTLATSSQPVIFAASTTGARDGTVTLTTAGMTLWGDAGVGQNNQTYTNSGSGWVPSTFTGQIIGGVFNAVVKNGNGVSVKGVVARALMQSHVVSATEAGKDLYLRLNITAFGVSGPNPLGTPLPGYQIGKITPAFTSAPSSLAAISGTVLATEPSPATGVVWIRIKQNLAIGDSFSVYFQIINDVSTLAIQPTGSVTQWAVDTSGGPANATDLYLLG